MIEPTDEAQRVVEFRVVGTRVISVWILEGRRELHAPTAGPCLTETSRFGVRHAVVVFAVEIAVATCRNIV